MLQKHEDYYSNTRWDIIKLIPRGDHRILEIGCGQGDTGEALKQQGKTIEVVGIEKEPAIAKAARTKLDEVICTDVETAELPFSEDHFDYVIAADVLEHLIDPWMLVDKIRRHLKRGGHLIASIPNIRNWRTIIDLFFKGQWTYRPDGLLDDTHLRFFTKKSILKLFQSRHFEVDYIVPNFKLPMKKQRNITSIINSLTLHLLEDFLTFQYIIIARKL